MHGQTPQFAGLRTRPYEPKTAREVILPVASLAGGADGDNRLGLECAPQPSRMVIGQRIETYRLAGAQVKHIRLCDRRVVDVVELEGLLFSAGTIPDRFAALGLGVHAQDVHCRVADHLVHRCLLGVAHLGDVAVTGQLEGTRLANGQVQLVDIALGIADHHGDVALVQPAASDVAA